MRATDVRLARDVIADIFAGNDRVFLAFSGGKESLVLARLCEPYVGRFSLVWSNTGFTFPHMEALIRSYGERFGLEELKSDLIGNWQAHGIPASTLPMANAMPDGMHQVPKLQPWLACCANLRGAPLHQFIAGQIEPTAILHGQRRQDRAPGLGMSGWKVPDTTTIIAPIADWTDEEVMAFLKDEGIDLPAHYGVVVDSLDCWICPSAFGEAKGPARAAYMRKAYPELLETVMPGVRRARDAARASLDIVNASMMLTAAQEAAGPCIVMQWAPSAGDCLVAALATVLGRTYAETAELLGVTLDAATGEPVGLQDKGIAILEMSAPLLAIGLSSTLLMSKAAEGTLDAATMRRHLQGSPAILQVRVEHDGRQELHALAWTGARLFDCRGPATIELDIDAVEILAAVIIAERKSGIERRAA